LTGKSSFYLAWAFLKPLGGSDCPASYWKLKIRMNQSSGPICTYLSDYGNKTQK